MQTEGMPCFAHALQVSEKEKKEQDKRYELLGLVAGCYFSSEYRTMEIYSLIIGE